MKLPRMGVLAGFDIAEKIDSNCLANGTVNIGTLHTETWTTGKWPFRQTHTWNQARYAAGNKRIASNGF